MACPQSLAGAGLVPVSGDHETGKKELRRPLLAFQRGKEKRKKTRLASTGKKLGMAARQEGCWQSPLFSIKTQGEAQAKWRVRDK